METDTNERGERGRESKVEGHEATGRRSDGSIDAMEMFCNAFVLIEHQNYDLPISLQTGHLLKVSLNR